MHFILQSMPQSLNDFLLHPYAMDDPVWAGITRQLTTALDVVDAQYIIVQGLWQYTVVYRTL